MTTKQLQTQFPKAGQVTADLGEKCVEKADTKQCLNATLEKRGCSQCWFGYESLFNICVECLNFSTYMGMFNISVDL